MCCCPYPGIKGCKTRYFVSRNPLKYSLKKQLCLDSFMQFHIFPRGVLSYPHLHRDVSLLRRVNTQFVKKETKKQQKKTTNAKHNPALNKRQINCISFYVEIPPFNSAFACKVLTLTITFLNYYYVNSFEQTNWEKTGHRGNQSGRKVGCIRQNEE